MPFDADAALQQLRAESAPADVASMAEGGFNPDEALEELRGQALQRGFGTAGQQVVAGLEGAGQGLTFGLSTQIEKLLGVSPESIEAREKANPRAHTAGEVGGIAVPIIATLGGAAPAEIAGQVGARGAIRAAAELSAPSLISKAGGVAAKAVTGLLPEAESALGKAAVKVAAHTAQGAVEGGLYGAGHVVHEEALGDPNLTAQSALDEIKMSALFGGGIGGGIGATGGVLGALGKGISASKLGEKLGGWLEEFEGTRNLKAAGAVKSDITGAAKRISREELNKIGREAGEMGLVEPFSTPGATLEKATARMESAYTKMSDVLEGADGTPNAAPRSIEEIAGRVRKEVLSELESNPLEKGTARQLKEILSDYETKFKPDEIDPRFPEQGGTGELSFKDLHGIRKQLSKKLYGLRGTADPQATALKDALHDFRTIVSDEINKGLEKSGLDSAPWKAANREYQVSATIEHIAQKGADGAAGNNPVGLLSVIMGAAGLASHGVPGGALLALGSEAVKRYGSGIAGATARALRQSEAFGAMTTLAKANEAVAERISEGASSILSGARGAVVPRLAHAAVTERMEQVRHFASNPQAAMDALAQATDGVADHAPNVAMAMQTTGARALSFLASKLPPQPSTGPLGKQLHPTEQAKWQFSRYQAAVDIPTVVLRHAAAGTLTPMDIEAVQAVHPQLLEAMRVAAIDKLTSHKGLVPYQQRLMLSMLLGQPVDATMTPQAIQAVQAVYARPSQKSGEDTVAPRAKPSQTGLSKLKLGQRSMTGAQAAETRMNG